MNEQIEKFLQLSIERGASDLHLTVGAPPTLRISGELSQLSSFSALTTEDTERLVYSILNEEQRERLIVNKELDFSFSFREDARFRVNAYFSMGSWAVALRRIPLDIPGFDELHLPEICADFCKLPQGFILVTGPAGQGKSTTIAAMLDLIIKTRPLHVITIEDPIEYIFKHGRGLVEQREMHQDTLSWNVALRSALREDPDVVFIGEMRDYETVSSAVTIAETGHLVFSTLHTNSAAQTINRIIDVFPEEQQSQIQTQLASSLEVVISQRLVPALGGGVLPAFEILLSTPAVRNTIREGNSHQIDNIIATSREQGMLSLERDLTRLVKEGWVSADMARRACAKPEEFDRFMR